MKEARLIRINADLNRELERLAVIKGISVNALIAIILSDYIKTNE